MISPTWVFEKVEEMDIIGQISLKTASFRASTRISGNIMILIVGTIAI